MPNTYSLISSNVLTSSAASVTFSSIPATFTDLVLRGSARVDSASNYQSMAMAFNGGSPTSAFSQTWINGSGTGTTSGRYGSNTTLYPSYVNAASSTSNTFGSFEIYVPNYLIAQSKPIGVFGATENNATDARIEADAMLWASNNSVASITLYGNTNFVSGSSFYLYGIKNS
jgi:hypothetical protein